MRSDFRLRTLTIEAFRGFNHPTTFDLDASAVVLTGPNGTGKTSMFDALQWLLLGSIERLEALRARRTVEHVVSKYREGDRARVSLAVAINGEEVLLTRTGDRKDSTLEVSSTGGLSLFGDGATEWLDDVLVPAEPGSLNVALTTCGLLQQDVMRSVLEAKPADRFAHISAVLGLGELESFESQAKDALKALADRELSAGRDVALAQATVSELQQRIEVLENQALARTSVEAIRSQVQKVADENSSLVEVGWSEELTTHEAVELSAGLRQLAADIESWHSRRLRSVSARESFPERVFDDDYRALAAVADDASDEEELATTQLSDVRGQLSVAESAAADIERLAAAALPMLTEHCPVCGQSIVPSDVRMRLSELSSESETLLRLREQLVEAERAAATAEDRRRATSQALASATETNDRWASSDREVAEIDSKARELVSDPRLRGGDAEWLVEHGRPAAESLITMARLVEQYGDALTESQSSGENDRARAELGGAESALASRETAAAAVAARASQMRALSEAASKARLAVTRSRFRAIEPLVSDIYRRLDPHPAFKGLGFQHDVHYKRGTSTPVVTDPVSGIEADPLIVFSASQANIAALSYFLAMSFGAGDRSLPFVLLDDPLQSMDDVNVLGFADLCRFTRSQRQLILSTHDRRFASLLRRKLSPRSEGDRTVVFEFTGWDRRGPIVSAEPESYVPGADAVRLLADPA